MADDVDSDGLIDTLACIDSRAQHGFPLTVGQRASVITTCVATTNSGRVKRTCSEHTLQAEEMARMGRKKEARRERITAETGAYWSDRVPSAKPQPSRLQRALQIRELAVQVISVKGTLREVAQLPDPFPVCEIGDLRFILLHGCRGEQGLSLGISFDVDRFRPVRVG